MHVFRPGASLETVLRRGGRLVTKVAVERRAFTRWFGWTLVTLPWSCMPLTRLFPLVGLWLLAAATLPVRAADPPASRRDADLLKKKIALIAEHGSAGPSDRRLQTTMTEQEVNSYLAYEGQGYLPGGVVSPGITILGPGRVSGRAIVDLDQIREDHKPTSLFDPMRFLRGRLPITATGGLATSNGVATFQFESAEISGLPIPKLLLQQIVAYYSRSPERPSGFSLDDPVALPARIREIQLQRGQAIVIQ